ncbi:hypothetical protein [Kitasatospora sp. NPDC088783]|uniref:hypothetical protein n=1 Tax=Kitasatospora sp. NPDC088783 TaxID=3364077 RepID=UPI0037FE314A
MRPDVLLGPVPGLDDALGVVDRFDQVLAEGLLRLGPAHADALTELGGAVAGSPLAAQVGEAAEKTAAGLADENHLTALAAARCALLGAAHDALHGVTAQATGRATAPWTAPPGTAGPPASPNLLAAARSWLSDIARTGWRSIDTDLVAASRHIVAAMLADSTLRRQAVLIDGFAGELDSRCTGADPALPIPRRRWADLWSRALLLAHPAWQHTPAARTVTGRLLPLGVDLHEHATAVQAQVHAVLEPADGSQPFLVRASVSASKPSSVVGAGCWLLLRPHLSLLSALSAGRSMTVADMPATSEGDLLWDEAKARPGDPADPFVTARIALPGACGMPAAPLERHPVRLAEPVFVDGYTAVEEDGILAFSVGGYRLPVAADRIPAASPLTARDLAASTACIGLLRWDDGGFHLQPLAVETTLKGRSTAVHAGAWAGVGTDPAAAKAETAAAKDIAVLHERAGKLLRR